MDMNERQKIADRLMLARGKRAYAWQEFDKAHREWMQTSLFYADQAKHARDEKNRTMKLYDEATREVDEALEAWHKMCEQDGIGGKVE